MEPKSHFQKTIACLPEFYDSANERDDSRKSLTIIDIDVADRFVIIECDKLCPLRLLSKRKRYHESYQLK